MISPTEQLLRDCRHALSLGTRTGKTIVVSPQDLAKLIEIVEVLQKALEHYAGSSYEAQDVSIEALAKADAIAKGDD